jgi:serine/threonine-protein kinase
MYPSAALAGSSLYARRTRDRTGMQIQTAEDLIEALRGSRLYTPEQVSALASELAPLGDDPQVLMRHLLHRDQITLYQLRKILHGKSADLFLGPYVISDKLGEGGMGKVYRARHTRTDREVALKVVRSNLLSNPTVRRRYDREVRAATSLQHPNIVSVFDAAELDGRVFLAMEFVDGIDLSRLIREHGMLWVAEACEYVRQASLGLQHAHEQGLVHRDIKPSNIIVSGERHIPDAAGRASVKILDMGLVRAVGFDDGGGGPDLTRAGTVVGTPDYMAPEQAKDSRTVDCRADLYSLGCAFYFLLTGKPPFHEGTGIEKLLKHQVDPPPPLQAARPDVPGELAAIVARLMAKKPDDRFATAYELAAALVPLTVYPPGGVAITTPPPRADAMPAPSSPSTFPSSFYGPASSMQGTGPASRPGGTGRAEPLPAATPVATTSDKTPRPAYVPAEPDPFPEAEEVDEVPRVVELPGRRKRRKPPRSKAPLVVAIVAGVMLLAAVVTWAIVRSGSSGTTPPAKSGKTR